MSNLNTACQICGKKYHYCKDCRKYDNWRRIADTPEHYQIAMILTDYREGVTNDVETTQRFNDMNITLTSDLSLYLDAVARDIKKILEKGTVKKSISTDKDTTEKISAKKDNK